MNNLKADKLNRPMMCNCNEVGIPPFHTEDYHDTDVLKTKEQLYLELVHERTITQSLLEALKAAFGNSGEWEEKAQQAISKAEGGV